MKTVFSVTAGLIAAAACLGGCYHNVTPELQGIAYTDKEVVVNRKVSMNQNTREISDDLARAFLLDNPSHLSPWPIVDTSGMPR